jgi:hypothetical protein
VNVLAYPMTAVVARLKGTNVLKLVGSAADLVEATKTPPRADPAVFLASVTKGQGQLCSGPTIQQNRRTWVQLVLWVKNHGGAEAVIAKRDEVAAAIEARLAGFTPGDAFGDLLLDAQRDEFSHGAWLVTQLVYTSDWTFSAEVQP